MMAIKSPAFLHNHPIPERYTCDGADVSPPLAWSGVPAEAKSLVLIVDDPDAPDPAAPQMTYVHWVLYNIPPDVSGLEEGAATDALPSGAVTGINDWRNKNYGGPCPPTGRHRYFFKLYALDALLPHLKHPTKAAVESVIEGHILARAELIGLYRRP
jgi:Raf kinase inhibitor-like YbhB/YbcL family protein